MYSIPFRGATYNLLNLSLRYSIESKAIPDPKFVVRGRKEEGKRRGENIYNKIYRSSSWQIRK